MSEAWGPPFSLLGVQAGRHAFNWRSCWKPNTAATQKGAAHLLCCARAAASDGLLPPLGPSVLACKRGRSEPGGTRAKHQHAPEPGGHRAPPLCPQADTLTLVVHEPPAELLERASVAHGAQGAVELVVGHHQVLGVPSHVYDLRGGDRQEGRGSRWVADPPPRRPPRAGSQAHSPPTRTLTGPHQGRPHGPCGQRCRAVTASAGAAPSPRQHPLQQRPEHLVPFPPSLDFNTTDREVRVLVVRTAGLVNHMPLKNGKKQPGILGLRRAEAALRLVKAKFNYRKKPTQTRNTNTTLEIQAPVHGLSRGPAPPRSCGTRQGDRPVLALVRDSARGQGSGVRGRGEGRADSRGLPWSPRCAGRRAGSGRGGGF